jgi:hypothetical protein
MLIIYNISQFSRKEYYIKLKFDSKINKNLISTKFESDLIHS